MNMFHIVVFHWIRGKLLGTNIVTKKEQVYKA